MQVAAVSISAPVFTILMAFGNLFGIGGSSAIARALGAKNWNVQNRYQLFVVMHQLE